MKTLKTTLLVILTAGIWGLVPVLYFAGMDHQCVTDSECEEMHGDPCDRLETLPEPENSSLWPYCPQSGE